MFDTLFITSIIGSCVGLFKESHTKTVPAENWANKELYHNDLMNGVSVEQRMKNLENGKYKISKTYPEPHRDPISGKIIIENCLLYDEDIKRYGAYQAYKWAEQGRYNLTPEELKKEQKRLDDYYKKLDSL